MASEVDSGLQGEGSGLGSQISQLRGSGRFREGQGQRWQLVGLICWSMGLLMVAWMRAANFQPAKDLFIASLARFQDGGACHLLPIAASRCSPFRCLRPMLEAQAGKCRVTVQAPARCRLRRAVSAEGRLVSLYDFRSSHQHNQDRPVSIYLT